MTKPVTITLAGEQHAIEQLTIGQIEDLNVTAMLPDTEDPQVNMRQSFLRQYETIATGLGGDWTPEKVRGMRCTLNELSLAYRAVLEHAGMIQAKKDTPTGEAEAAVGSTSGSSTAA